MVTESEAIYDRAADIGKLVKLSSKTIYKLAVAEPTFLSIRIGGSVRFPRQRVIEWLRAREVGRE